MGLNVLVDLLDDALVVHNRGVVVPQQSILTTLFGVVTNLCQIHAEWQLNGKMKKKFVLMIHVIISTAVTVFNILTQGIISCHTKRQTTCSISSSTFC